MQQSCTVIFMDTNTDTTTQTERGNQHWDAAEACQAEADQMTAFFEMTGDRSFKTTAKEFADMAAFHRAFSWGHTRGE